MPYSKSGTEKAKNHHTADVMIGTALLAAGPAGWAIGLIYMGVDLISLGTTGKGLTENIFD